MTMTAQQITEMLQIIEAAGAKHGWSREMIDAQKTTFISCLR